MQEGKEPFSYYGWFLYWREKENGTWKISAGAVTGKDAQRVKYC